MTEFISDQPAIVANKNIKSSLKTRDAAQQCAVLWFEDILNRKLFRKLGYSSINQYAKLELGFSKSHTGEFLALCHTFKKLPWVKEKVASGKLNYTPARVLGTVIDEKNQDAWLHLATKSRPSAVVPVRVKMVMSPAQFARYEKLWEQVRKTGTLRLIRLRLCWKIWNHMLRVRATQNQKGLPGQTFCLQENHRSKSISINARIVHKRQSRQAKAS